jgi:hypothetical protein
MAFDYTAAEWTTFITAKTSQLEQATDSICYNYFDELCTSYVATKVKYYGRCFCPILRLIQNFNFMVLSEYACFTSMDVIF